MRPEDVRTALQRGRLEVHVDGQPAAIEAAMVKLDRELPADVVAVPTPHGELYLDLRLSPEIRAEGYAREIIRRIPQMRKDLNLEVDDYIVASVHADSEMAKAIESFRDRIGRETRSRTLDLVDGPISADKVAEWNDIDGHSVTIGVTPLHAGRALRDFTEIRGFSPQKAMLLFDAGFRDLAGLKRASKKTLGAIEGLEAGDIARIVEFLAAGGTTSRRRPSAGQRSRRTKEGRKSKNKSR
jgi:uncharacterized protein YeeX (DUF496 family)